MNFSEVLGKFSSLLQSPFIGRKRKRQHVEADDAQSNKLRLADPVAPAGAQTGASGTAQQLGIGSGPADLSSAIKSDLTNSQHQAVRTTQPILHTQPSPRSGRLHDLQRAAAVPSVSLHGLHRLNQQTGGLQLPATIPYEQLTQQPQVLSVAKPCKRCSGLLLQYHASLGQSEPDLQQQHDSRVIILLERRSVSQLACLIT